MDTAKQAPGGNGEVSGFEPDYAAPPGWTLEEWLNDNNLTVNELSRACGIPAERIKRLITGETEISGADAARLDAATHIPANLWNEMERIYREALIRLGKR